LVICCLYRSLGVVAFELWHPFSTGMERVKMLQALRESGTFPDGWDTEHPEVQLQTKSEAGKAGAFITLITKPGLPRSKFQVGEVGLIEGGGEAVRTFILQLSL